MKTIATVILTLIALISFGQSKDKYEKYYDSLVARGQYDELIHFFEKELKKYPKSEYVLRSIGHAHIAKNNLDLGEKYYREALAVNPNCARCYLNIGVIFSLRENNNKALEYFDKAVNTDTTDATLYSER